MKRKKILFLLDSLNNGGAEKSLLDIIFNMSGYDVEVLTLFKGNDLWALYESYGIKVDSLNLNQSLNFIKILTFLIPKVKSIQPDIIHSTLYHSDISSRLLTFFIKIKIVNSFVSSSYSNNRYALMSKARARKHRLIQRIDRLTSFRVNLFISNSKTSAVSNMHALSVPKEKIKVIYRGRSADKFLKKDSYTRAYDKEVTFLNVGRLVDAKGQEDLIEAFSIILKDNKQVRLKIAGDGPLMSTLQKKIIDFGLMKEVTLLGNRTDVISLLFESDFFVFPSHYEGLPGALIEAMFAKIPIIASDIPENLECVDASCALLHQRGHVEDLANKMQEAITYSQWETLTERAYQKALANFEIQAVAQQYETTYNALLHS